MRISEYAYTRIDTHKTIFKRHTQRLTQRHTQQHTQRCLKGRRRLQIRHTHTYPYIRRTHTYSYIRHTNSQSPEVSKVDGAYRFDKASKCLYWSIPEISEQNSSGGFEFKLPGMLLLLLLLLMLLLLLLFIVVVVYCCCCCFELMCVCVCVCV